MKNTKPTYPLAWIMSDSLNNEELADIRALYKHTSLTQKNIATMYGITLDDVWIVNATHP
jgi:hypothetical protein